MSGTDDPGEGHIWQRRRAGWHALVGASVLLTAVFMLFENLPVRDKVVELALLAVLLVWYVLVGTKALLHVEAKLTIVYFAGVFVVLAPLFPISWNASFLLFMLNPHIFAMVSSWRVRLPLLILLYGQIGFWAVYEAGFTLFGLELLSVTAVVPMLFAVILGAYVTGIIDQSKARAQLIDELKHTRAELAVERHEAGVHAERERLAAEIHDTLAQGFTSILMLTQAARHGRPEEVPELLSLIERSARENLAEARALVGALTPPDLDGSGLPQALDRLAERHTRDTGVPVTVTVAGAPSPAALPLPGTDVVLLRSVQEALTNVRRHAGTARMVCVELTYGVDSTSVVVTDDGDGFDPAATAEGYGLPGLRGRATTFGGTCTVSSIRGAGTTVRVEIPAPGGNGATATAADPEGAAP
jgi:signal transduction histidine kinase